MGDLKDSWKETGVGFGHAFQNFGKAFVKTAKKGAKKVSDWADDEEKPKENEEKKD